MSQRRSTRLTKAVKLLPSITHWIDVKDNHIPYDVWLLAQVIDPDGEALLCLAYKSKATDAWVGADFTALEEENEVLKYSIITNEKGVTFSVNPED